MMIYFVGTPYTILALVFSKLEYCCPVWLDSLHVLKIEKIDV